MNEQWFEKMEKYLQAKMSPEERLQFEAEVAANSELSSDFNIFKTLEEEMPSEVKNAEVQQSVKQAVADMFEQFLPGEGKSTHEIKPPRPKALYFIIASVAASIIAVFLIAYLFIFRSGTDTQLLAGKYIQENLTVLNISMGSSEDRLEEGKIAFNEKNYSKALQLFETAYKIDSTNMDTKKYIGIVYLITKNYDNAIRAFDELAASKNLKYNWGHFYKAVTLLYRNKAGDKNEAGKELKKVVNEERAQGDDEAEKWLRALGDS